MAQVGYSRTNFELYDGSIYQVDSYATNEIDKMYKDSIQRLTAFSELIGKNTKLSNNNEALIIIINEVKNEEEKIKEILCEERGLEFRNLVQQVMSPWLDTIWNLERDESEYLVQNIEYIINNLREMFNRVENLTMFKVFNNIKDANIVIVGGNGAGKSTIASRLKELFSDNLTVLQAQKFLYFDEENYSVLRRSKGDVQSQQNSVIMSLAIDYYNTHSYKSNILESFTSIVVAITNLINKENAQYAENQIKLEIDSLELTIAKFNEIWRKIIPDIEFTLTGESNYISPKRNGKIYQINSLSDGEKVVFYYIGSVFLAKENSYIIVDEPETHLNPAVYNILWDQLESCRSDCKFIYISHNKDFILSRNNSRKLWIQKFIFPDQWEYKLLENIDDLPELLFIELLGSKKKVILCEGTKESIDYKVYSKLFVNEYTVLPVGGHIEVINYTKAFNKSSSLHSNKAYGIIDNDNIPMDLIETYKTENIFILPYNEIEMFLCTKIIAEKVLGNLYSNNKEIDRKYDEFASKTIERVTKKKNLIKMDILKKKYDSKLSRYRLQNFDSLDSICSEINKEFSESSIKESYQQIDMQIEDDINIGDIENILKICNLKQEVSKGIANVVLDHNYLERAIMCINNDKALCESIKSSFFSELK